MIVEFTVGNFLSFNKKRKLNFRAKGISELKKNITSIEKLVRSAVIYGANSSGKSNLISAIQTMKDMVLSSVKLNDTEELEYKPFLLSSDSEEKPTYFEIIFLIEGKKYRYGFEYNLFQIIEEWLFEISPTKDERPLFLRTLDGIGVTDKFKEGKGKEVSTNDNRLFISLVAQLGGSVSKKIIEWFDTGYNVISGLDHNDYKGYTNRMLHKKLTGCDESLNFFKTLKLGFKDLLASEAEFDPSEVPDDMPKQLKSKIIKELTGQKRVTLDATHNKFDKNGNIVGEVFWDRDDNESQGTNKIIDLSGPIFDTLALGKLLVIDELDAKLHPLITTHIVNLFNDPKKNFNNAQLLFATHDTNLLSSELFRRDQIWFTEKDRLEQTDLYSLYNFNLPDGTKVRNDGNFEKNYIRGRYGAIPFITN
ncbi:MAG TPA: ATP-binding protein [Sphingobacteriaceae bacterium]|nr:ATP-binding protein [Sphingobacteriaceae bacterium]